jgi:hypothetical protein
MKPSHLRKLVDAALLLVPIIGALVASAAVRAASPVKGTETVTITWAPGSANAPGAEKSAGPAGTDGRGFTKERYLRSGPTPSVPTDGALIIESGGYACQWGLSGSGRDNCQSARREGALNRRAAGERLSRLPLSRPAIEGFL